MSNVTSSAGLAMKPWSPIARRSWIGLHAAVGAVIVFAACSSGSDDAANPATTPAETTVDSAEAPPATTADESATTTSEAAPGTDPDVPVAGLVSFGSDVQPILENNCASCHVANGPGTVHLNMEQAGNIGNFEAEYIDAVVSVGFMPPWPAGDGDVAFHDDRRLTDDDVATLATWVQEGGLIDVDPTTPLVPARNVVEPIERDYVLQGEPYKGNLDDKDDYRCQIYDPELTELNFLQSYGIEADQTEVVHHGLLFKAGADVRANAEELDASDPAVGWSCTGLAGVPGVNQILSWAPGQAPTALPSDTGIAMGAGDFFVMQIHYHYEPELADLPADQSSLVLDMADADVVAANGGLLDPIDLTVYLGPAEIPCSTEESGPLCDRDAAIADLGTRSGTLAGGAANGLLSQCGATVEDFAEMTDGIATSTCDLSPRPGQIVSVWGHEHEIGKAFRMTLNPDTPEELVLLDIPNWDFNWQLNYSPVDDIILDDDDIIRIECTWDRARLPDDAEPRYVLWAEGTNDEMCYSQIITRPV